MEDSQKLLALKKAYADIILNTAKEAAARVMASERKAMRFQQELASTKDEALRMLLRLKQMLDSKVKEAELTSLSQQKKVDELEAQLQEAEEIVSNLRAELREAETKLESVANHQMYPPVEQNIEGGFPTQENCLQDNRFDPYDGSVHPLPDLHVESVSISDTRNPSVSRTNDSSKLCVSHDHTHNCYIHNPDFASIVIRRKESELYRNGCTQRIRAFERSHFDANMSVSGSIDNVHDETLVKVHEEGKAMPVTTIAKADTISDKEKPDELKVVKADADAVKVPACKRRRNSTKALIYMSRSNQVTKRSKAMPVTTIAKVDTISDMEKPDELKVVKADADAVKVPACKRRRNSTKALIYMSRSNQVTKRSKALYLAAAKDSPCVLNNNDPSRVNYSMECENIAEKDLVRIHEEGKATTVTTNAKVDIICGKEKPDKLKVVKTDADLVKVPVLKKRRLYMRLHPDQVKKTNKTLYLSDAKGLPHVMDNNDPSRVGSSMVCEKEAEKDPMSLSSAKLPTDEAATAGQSESHNDIEKGGVFLNACSARNKNKDDKELLDKSDLTRQESLSTESLEVPYCRADVEKSNGSPDKPDSKASDLDEKVSCQPANDKFLKYTFQRKRKKEPVSSAYADCSLENDSSKKSGEKQNGHAEPRKSCPMTESSRDSRRLAQVARQLISLSEKKWWQ